MLTVIFWVLTLLINAIAFYVFFAMQEAVKEGFPPEAGIPGFFLRPGRITAFQFVLFASWAVAIGYSWYEIGFWKTLSATLIVLLLSHFIARRLLNAINKKIDSALY